MKKRSLHFPKSIIGFMPFLLGVLLVFIAVLPVRLPFFDSAIGPFVVLAIVYHTAVKYPSLCPAIGVFILGLLYDVLSAGPLGYWALIYLCAYMLSTSQKHLMGKEQLFSAWLAFAFIAVFSGVLSWVLGSLLYGQLTLYKETLSGMLTALLIYPFIYVLLIPVDRRFSASKLQGFGRA